MATLKGTTISETYPLLLKVESSGVDGTLRNIEDGDGTASALKISSGAIQVDNIKVDGNAITSTDSNGNIDLTPNGSGEVNISKVDIDSGTINGTTITSSVDIVIDTAGKGLADEFGNNILERTAGGYITIGDSAWNEVRLNTTGSTDFVLDNSGRVGIGVTSPSEIFHVQGTGVTDRFARFESTNFDMFLYIDADSGASNADADTGIIFRNNNSEDFRIGVDETDSSFHIATGSFGTASNKKLTIDSSGNSTFAGNVKLLGASSYARDLTFAHGATNYYWRMGYTDTSNGNSLVFINRDGGSEQEVMRMDYNKLTTFSGDVFVSTGDARLGVGVTSIPHWGSGFDVLSVGHSSQYACETADGADRNVFWTNNLYYDGTGTYGYARHYTDEASMIQQRAGTIRFFTDASGTADADFNPSERMRITSDGNVGIGTTSPTGLLEVANTSGNADIRIRSSNSGNSRLYFGDVADVGAGFVDYDHGTAMYFGTEGSTRMTITSDGELILKGTSLPTDFGNERGHLVISSVNHGSNNNYAILSLQGHSNSNSVGTGGIYFWDHSNNVAIIQADRATSESSSNLLFYTNNGSSLSERMRITDNGTVQPGANNAYNLGTTSLRWSVLYTSNSVNVSDETLKIDIQDCDLGIDFINTLKPKSFKMKDLEEKHDDYNKKHYGLIAQDLKDGKLKDSVYGDKDGDYGLAYNDLVAPLIKAVQELSAKVEALENA